MDRVFTWIHRRDGGPVAVVAQEGAHLGWLVGSELGLALWTSTSTSASASTSTSTSTSTETLTFQQLDVPVAAKDGARLVQSAGIADKELRDPRHPSGQMIRGPMR